MAKDDIRVLNETYGENQEHGFAVIVSHHGFVYVQRKFDGDWKTIGISSEHQLRALRKACNIGLGRMQKKGKRL